MTSAHPEIVLPSQIRRALLQDHARIRRLVDELEDIALRASNGDSEGRRLLAVAGQLGRALERHNDSEEEALANILRDVDSWGPLRVAEMLKEHAEEHDELVATLRSAGRLELARAVPDFVRRLRAHMIHEEKTFLTRELLREDLVTSGPTS